MGTTSQHWHIDLEELLNLEVPPEPMLRDIFLKTANLEPMLEAVFLTNLKDIFLLLKLLVFCNWGMACLTHWTSDASVPKVKTPYIHGH